ncbi:uncharacterized protein AB675_5069 [Cyphellophora attinorum]|uniref:Uncharacterized protein n=1 Tax=Cyphellophora attinorum TaxID=1664694 RepID=A0A0N0NLM8_9EURO|nr:uncharacterized protein AB675_5069 [Phialophora attinorum]KPI39219.1 hypothetical protein AB675_5069 [Phialophora attinorum]
MKTNVFLTLLFGVLAFVVGIKASDEQATSSRNSHGTSHGSSMETGDFPAPTAFHMALPSRLDSRILDLPITPPLALVYHGRLLKLLTQTSLRGPLLLLSRSALPSPPTLLARSFLLSPPTPGPRRVLMALTTPLIPVIPAPSASPSFPLCCARRRRKCGADDKLMSMTSRCEGHKFYACCPKGYQDLFDEDCVGLPSCKQKGKSSDKDWRKWKGVTPNGCVNCADGYSATPFFYGGCMADPLPDDFKDGKCTGPTGNKC